MGFSIAVVKKWGETVADFDSVLWSRINMNNMRKTQSPASLSSAEDIIISSSPRFEVLKISYEREQ